MPLTQTAFLFWGIDLGALPAFDEEFLDANRKSRDECSLLVARTEDSDGRAFAAVRASFLVADPWKHRAFSTPIVAPDWPEKLRAFTQALDLPWREPSWIVACEWSP